ncbi:MAG: hypothetical protein HAW67_04695 [Endozoicomonadaceae bacterium]|nr:hypothetical protein [Endozoicomonadaceae bacterium]
MNTNHAAEMMLKSGLYFTSATLAKELNISAKKASGLLYNIRTCAKYETDVTRLPNRTIKVLSICGRSKNIKELWRLVLNVG